jgi:hypothetical protein
MVHLSNIKQEAIMAKNYKDINYFETRPDIVKIFDDLDAFRNFCRIELAPFNEADLYNRDSWVWRNFEKSLRGKRQGDTHRKPRGEYNRSGNNRRHDSISH